MACASQENLPDKAAPLRAHDNKRDGFFFRLFYDFPLRRAGRDLNINLSGARFLKVVLQPLQTLSVYAVEFVKLIFKMRLNPPLLLDVQERNPPPDRTRDMFNAPAGVLGII